MLKFIMPQVCGLLLLIFIIYLTNRQKKINTKSGGAYKFALYITGISLCLDISSIYFIMNNADFPEWIVYLICKLYLVSLTIVGFSAFNYLTTELYYIKKFKYMQKVSAFVVILSDICILSTSIKPYYNGNYIYTYGVSVYITYFISLAFILYTMILTFALRKYINKTRRHSVIIWLSIWLIAALIQFIHNELLLVGFAGALGLTFVFGAIENPITYIDTETGLFNLKAIRSHAGSLFYEERSVYGICILLDTFSRSLTVEESKEIIINIGNFFNKLSKYIFRIDSYSFILMCEKDEVSDYFDKVKEFFDNLNQKLVCFNGIDVYYGIVKDDKVFNNLEDITNMYYYLKSIKGVEITEINENLLQKLKNQEVVKKEILSALDEDRVQVFYQPIYDNRTKTFTSAEALVRIFDEENNIISPASFIPIAESSGLIIPIGERVFQKVCEMFNEHQLSKLGVEYIEVNLSALQLEQYDLFDNFSKIMKENNIKPKQINLELTESVQLGNTVDINRTIHKFLQSGVKFSLDDFGTGNSNLDYISTMPIHIIKFDFKMTQGYFKNDKIKTIVEHIIPMMQGMGFEIVCEGIETREQLDTMANLGVEHIQGYYFSKPVAQEDYLEFINANN